MESNNNTKPKAKISFLDVIARYSRLHEPCLRNEGGNFYAWQKKFKAKVQTLRGRTINRVGLKAEFGEKEDRKTHWRQLVTIKATEISDVTGYLLTPKDDKGNGAGLIASPGHYDWGKDAVAGCDWAESDLKNDPYCAYGKYAVEAGYVVFVPEWWGWGDKSGHLDLIGERDKCNVIQMASSMYGFSVLNLHMLEADAIVDFLHTLDQVDSRRIGIVGNSYGGRTAMWIAAFNEKISCVVSAGSMNLFSERVKKLSSCAIQYFPGLLEYGDVGEVYSLIAPRPLQLQAGSKDELITPADRDVIARTVKQAYQSSNACENLSIEYFPGGHYLNWELAKAFLQKYL